MLIMKKSFLIIFLFASVLMSCNNSSDKVSTHSHEEAEEQVTYICPMDCEDGKTYHEEGECPVCGMALDELEEEE